MKIKILGSGCSRCRKLFTRVSEVVAENGLSADVEMIDDLKDIAAYGILMTPALVINGKLKCSVNVPSKQKIIQYIQEEI